MNMATANKLPCVSLGIPCWKVKDYCFTAHLFSLEIHFFCGFIYVKIPHYNWS